jgi:hypothetical protein
MFRILRELIIKPFKHINNKSIITMSSLSWDISKKINKSDKKEYSSLKKLHAQLEINKYNNRNMNFHKWLNKKNDSGFTNNSILNQMCNDVASVITDNNYTIDNKKELRDEIASFIYSLS